MKDQNPIRSIKHPGYPMWASELYTLLGDPTGNRPPVNGGDLVIQGHKIIVLPYDPEKGRRRGHRVLIECDPCGTLVSFGRYGQHKVACRKRGGR